ncbi:hypothetical protein FB45DRAFT_1002412 [Roridomyces roridus]|uniref:Uncharacterized protein n=1 Tax=Roridomyces roridus TaxID=1738132 RepID=A0AAD7BZL7_9AGAR|nr:hypothetical protein FB45DRAFT_1002412 [Roridomyces roridus]
MQFTTLLSIALASFGLVRAADNRLLFTIPAGTTVDAFTSSFEAACDSWAPAVAAGLTLQTDLVEAGDFSGQNADTEVRLVCSWTDGTTATLFTTDVAESLGATATS